MPRKGITQNDVVAAMAEIEDRGENPTVRSVRAHLGTGSDTTVSKYMAQIRLKAETNSEEVPDIPTPLAKKLSTIFHEVWKASYQQADEESRVHRQNLHNAGYSIGALKDLLLELADKASESEKYYHRAAQRPKKQ